jgi:hypothetical protein
MEPLFNSILTYTILKERFSPPVLECYVILSEKQLKKRPMQDSRGRKVFNRSDQSPALLENFHGHHGEGKHTDTPRFPNAVANRLAPVSESQHGYRS